MVVRVRLRVIDVGNPEWRAKEVNVSGVRGAAVVKRRTHGEVILPRRAVPLLAIGAAFPSLARLVLCIIR